MRILRACIVQGSQQIWVAALWYLGDKLNNAIPGTLTPWWIVCIVWPLAALSLFFVILVAWTSGVSYRLIPLIILLTSNAEYRRQTPPKVPNFYNTLFRRKLVLWFLFSLVLRDFWLSGASTI